MNNIDIRKADANYRGFPTLSKWNNIKINQDKWKSYTERIDKLSETDNETFLIQAQKFVRRYAAIETGAIEKLYETDRGFTWSVALELAGYESVLSDKGDDASRLIEAQMDAYDYILDLATGKQNIAEAWIRELHKVICRGQKFYKVVTSLGPQDHKLQHGSYKKQPNHVTQADGTIHSYCPADIVGAEMHRFIEELSSDNFNKLHPVIQAAYAHYSLVCIHPFSDGNGRVARALASIFLLRNFSIPFFVIAEDHENYINSLESADKHDYITLVNYTVDSCFNAIDLIELSIEESIEDDLDKMISKIDKLYLTKGGFTHEEVDNAGGAAMYLFRDILKEHFKIFKQYPNITDPSFHTTEHYPIPTKYRVFINDQGLSYFISIKTKIPITANARTDFRLYIPNDFDKNDSFVIHNINTDKKLFIRIDEIIPNAKPSLLLKYNIFVESSVKNLLSQLLKGAKESVENKN